MTPTRLTDMINERDNAIDDIDPYLPKTLESLANTPRRVQFKGGSVLTRIDTINEMASGDDVARETWVLRYEYPNGEEFFYKVPVYYNSWDDGNPDEWAYDGNIVEVNRVPVTTFKWEEV